MELSERKIQKKIFITGDISKDFLIVKGKRFNSFIKETMGTLSLVQMGGASIILDFLNNFKEYISDINSEREKHNAKEESKKALLDTYETEFGYNDSAYDKLTDTNKTYANISDFKKDDITLWGIDKEHGFDGFGGYSGEDKKLDPNDVIERPVDCNVLLIDDAGMEYSLSRNEDLWNKQVFADNSNIELIILKKSGFINRGTLLKELVLRRNCEQDLKNKNLIVVISIDDLRKNAVKISKGISWEQTVLDLIYELNFNSHCNELMVNCDYLIITFGTAGALLAVNKGNKKFEYRLIFDPDHLEGEWESSFPWDIIGKMSCFVAALSARIDLSESDLAIENAVKASLCAVREFYKKGYARDGNNIKLYYKDIAAKVFADSFEYSSAYAPSPGNIQQEKDKEEFRNMNWSILLDNYNDGKISKGVFKIIKDLATEVVYYGRGSLLNVPSLKFGTDFFTVDRKEIESLRNIKSLVTNYFNSNIESKPLSILIAGPAGAGKSFIVKKIAKDTASRSESEIPILEFNLSQFKTTDELMGAFHRIRDKALLGTPPVVFWDEFDTDNYIWLKSFISPMQDNSFQDGQITYHVGKCIFIFAGAVFSCIDDYDPKNNKGKNIEDFAKKKGPDFLSRIHGTLEVMGPNKRADDDTDVLYPLRRAMFIRSILRLSEDENIDIEWGLLRALLSVEEYKNGSRSLENLLKQIRINKEKRKNIVRSDLPAESIMKLHVDTKDFLGRISVEKEHSLNIFEIAPKIHAHFKDSDTLKDKDVMIEYKYLPTFLKASNIAAAERISKILGHHGLKIVASDHEPLMTEEDYMKYIHDNDKRHLLSMAKMEHALWMKFHEENGWRNSEEPTVKNKYEKKHCSLVEWDKLTENDKKKDLEMVEKYFSILNESGLGITKS